MSLGNFPKMGAMRFSAIGLLLGLGSALYVYRISLGEINISILRFATLVIFGCLIWKIFRGKKKILLAHYYLVVGIAVLAYVNAVWYVDLEEYPAPKREMVSHFINLITMLVIVMWVSNEQQLIRLVNGYLVASILAIFIGYFGLFFGALPFEDFLRAYGSAYAESLQYISDDGAFRRLTGPFMDPNFFGVYLLTVFIFAVWIFFFVNRNRVYLLIAVASLISLPLTMSRTAIVGLLSFFIFCIFWLPRKYTHIVLILSAMSALIGGGVLISEESFVERMLDTESLVERIRFATVGMSAFAANPFFGSGPAGIVDQDTGIATTHLMYLSLLSKFGLVGAAPYFLFVFYPLIKVEMNKAVFRREYRFLVTGLYLPLLFMYFLYDFLFFLEFQYFIFAIGYLVVFSPFSRNMPSVISESHGVFLSSTGNNPQVGEAEKCVG